MDSIIFPDLPGFRSTMIPEKYRQHPLTAGRWFYTLPRGLLKEFDKEVGLVPELKDLEFSLSDSNGDHTARVGFHDGWPVNFGFLRNNLPSSESDFFKEGLTGKDVAESLRVSDERLSQVCRNLRAYLGWLLSNPTFLEEHAKLWPTIAPAPGEAMPKVVSPAIFNWATSADQAEIQRREPTEGVLTLPEFCARWQLTNLHGPLLPEPLGVQSPVVLPEVAAAQAMASGFDFVSIPTIQPLPSETELRALLEDARRRDGPEHLREWTDLIRAGNLGKQKLKSYRQVFEVQHYWRLLQTRHSSKIYRNQGLLKQALAEFLKVSPVTMQRFMDLINKRLGEQWWDRYPLPTT